MAMTVPMPVVWPASACWTPFRLFAGCPRWTITATRPAAKIKAEESSMLVASKPGSLIFRLGYRLVAIDFVFERLQALFKAGLHVSNLLLQPFDGWLYLLIGIVLAGLLLGSIFARCGSRFSFAGAKAGNIARITIIVRHGCAKLLRPARHRSLGVFGNLLPGEFVVFTSFHLAS